MKIGLILECQKPSANWLKNADELICCHIVKNIEPGTEFQIIYKGVKTVLLDECGEDAAKLLNDGCCCVIIVWDLYPPWGSIVDPARDHAAVQKNLSDAGVSSTDPVYPICISYEIETWFLVDRLVLVDAFPRIKASKIKHVKNPERTDPKTILSNYFGSQYMGRTSHVIQLLKGLTVDKFDRIKNNCSSFKEFTESIGKCKTASQ